MAGVYYGQFPAYDGDVPPVNIPGAVNRGMQRQSGSLPYSPAIQADEFTDNLPHGPGTILQSVPSPQQISRIMPQRLPVKVHQAAVTCNIVAAFTPVKLVPINSTRITIIIGNNDLTHPMYFSYGAPSQISGSYIGLPIDPCSIWTGLYGVSCIDEIWVWTIDAGTYPRLAICYEGQLSLSNLNP